MRSLVFITFLLLIRSPSLLAKNWTGISDCGTYQVKGVARLTTKKLVLVVNEKTQSEVTISVRLQNETSLAPYVDKAIEALMNFEKIPQGSETEGTIKEIKSRIPNPLNPMDTGIKLISMAKCR